MECGSAIVSVSPDKKNKHERVQLPGRPGLYADAYGRQLTDKSLGVSAYSQRRI